MSVANVIDFFNQQQRPVEILTFEDTSTVAKAAASLGVTECDEMMRRFPRLPR